MRCVIFALGVLLFACKKNNSATELLKPINDSIQLSSIAGSSHYQLDLDDDGTKDVDFFGRIDLSSSGTEMFWVRLLNASTKVDVVSDSFRVCLDTVIRNNIPTLNFFNCLDSTHRYSTGSVSYSPFLPSNVLSITAFQPSIKDTVVFGYGKILIPAAPSAGAQYWNTGYGLFTNNSTGYLLFRVGPKQIALSLSLRIPYLIFNHKGSLN